MITNDIFMFVSKADVNKVTSNQTKPNERDKNGAFDAILNSKRETTNYYASNNNNNSKASSINHQSHDTKRKHIRDDSMREKLKDNDSAFNNQIKDAKVDKAKDEEKIVSDLEEKSEENDSDNTYNYLASFLLGAVDCNKTCESEGLTEELAKTQLSDESAISLKGAESPEEDMGLHQNSEILTELTETSETFELTELQESNSEITIKHDNEKHIDIPEKENSLFSLESRKLGEGTNEEIKADDFKAEDLFSKIFSNGENESIEEAVNSKVKASSDDKTITLQNINDEKDFVNNEELQSIDELDAQTIFEIKDQNIFSQFNGNDQNYSRNALGDTLDFALNEKNVTFSKDNIFEQIVEKVKIDMDKTDEIRIKLKPDFLGEISLKLSTEKGMITARAYVDNYNVKQLIESNLDSLKENMKELGLNFEALDVSVGKDSGFDRNNGQAWKQTQRNKTRKPSIEKIHGNMTYEEEIKQIVGGLYSAEGNINITV